jgi:hypothetical protein
VYVDGARGAVVQHTTRASRTWAWLGAIPHWLYFTPLRKHQAQWTSVVVWLSLAGTITAIIGMIVALWTYSPRKRYRYRRAAAAIPYRGWKRWHTIAGLAFGVITMTWVFSGLLSMGPFPVTTRLAQLTTGDRPSDDGRERFDASVVLGTRGSLPLDRYAQKDARQAIESLGAFDVRDLDYASFAEVPVYIASNGSGDSRIIPVDGEPQAGFDVATIVRMLRTGLSSSLAEVRVLHQYDAYYLDRRRRLPLPVVVAQLTDPGATRYYIDPETARVVGTYRANRWVARWLYHGLHSLDFPYLYLHRPLWDIVAIVLLLGGTALSFTSAVLSWRVLVRRSSRPFRRQPAGA